MGKKPDEIQREIAQHRDGMNLKADELRARVRRDVTDARAAVGDELAERSRLHEYAEKRPFVTVASALGAGMIAGAVTSGRKREQGTGKPSAAPQPTSSPDAANGSLIGELLGAITGNVSGTLRDEVRQAVRGLFDLDRGSAAGEKPRASGPQFTDHLAAASRDGEHNSRSSQTDRETAEPMPESTSDAARAAAANKSRSTSAGRTVAAAAPHENGHGGNNAAGQ